MTNKLECRTECGACCIAPSISSAIPGMPNGKPAGVPCIQLNNDFSCRLFGHVSRPEVCNRLFPSPEMCKSNRNEALIYLTELEIITK